MLMRTIKAVLDRSATPLHHKIDIWVSLRRTRCVATAVTPLTPRDKL